MPAPTCPRCNSSCFEQLDDGSYVCCNCGNILTERRMQQRRVLAEIVEKIEKGEELKPCENCGARPIFGLIRRIG